MIQNKAFIIYKKNIIDVVFYFRHPNATQYPIFQKLCLHEVAAQYLFSKE